MYIYVYRYDKENIDNDYKKIIEFHITHPYKLGICQADSNNLYEQYSLKNPRNLNFIIRA